MALLKTPHTIFLIKCHLQIVGWGFDQNNELSSELHQATMPVIPENICYKSNPLFYAKVLNENKFCAGFKNGELIKILYGNDVKRVCEVEISSSAQLSGNLTEANNNTIG